MTKLSISRIIFIGLLTFSVLQATSLAQAAGKEEEELFLVAQKAFDDGFYDVAIRYIEQFLQQYPQTEKRIQASLLLGQCHFFNNQYLKAYEVFQKLLPYNEFKDATLFWLGETYFKGSDYKQAENYYKQLIDVYPNSAYIPQAYYSLGWTYFEQNNYKEAKKLFYDLAKKFPDHQLTEDASFKLGECEFNSASYPAAIQYFQNYISRYPQSARQADAHFYIGESYYYQNDFLTAVTFYAKAANLAYDSKIAFMSKISMGWSYLKLSKYDLSKKYFDEAQKLAQEKNILSDDIYLGQASLFSETGDQTQALQAYTDLITKFPNSPRLNEARLGKANSLYALKNFPQATQEYQGLIDALSKDQTHPDILEKAYYGLAWTYLKSGNIDASIKSFEGIINKASNNVVKVSALTQIGDAYQDVEQLDKAIDVYDRILKDYPDSAYIDYVQFREGVALLKLNKIEAATLSFQTLQNNFPASKYLGDVKYYLGVAYFKKEDWAQAVKFTELYLKELPDGPYADEAKYILAQSYFGLQNFEKSMTLFTAIIAAHPEQKTMLPLAELYVAKCLLGLGKEAEAIGKFIQISAKYPGTETEQNAILWLGDHALEKAQYDDAVKYYESFIQKFPGSDKINAVHFELGQTYQAQSQLGKALEQYKLVANAKDKEIFAKAKLAIADIFSQDVDPQTAIQSYLDITTAVPDFKRDAYVKIGRIYANHKRYAEAIGAYQQALKSDKGLSDVSNAELQFYIADSLESLSRPQEAVEAYLKIPYLYSFETAWMIKAYLRVGRIFEDLEKWDEAKAVYKKIIDFHTDESKYAKERMDWIDDNLAKKK